MTKWVIQVLQQVEQYGRFRKLHYFTVIQLLKPGKDNTWILDMLVS